MAARVLVLPLPCPLPACRGCSSMQVWQSTQQQGLDVGAGLQSCTAGSCCISLTVCGMCTDWLSEPVPCQSHRNLKMPGARPSLLYSS